MRPFPVQYRFRHADAWPCLNGPDSLRLMANLDVFACRGRNGAPRAAEVESLYLAAFQGKPHYEPQERAAQDARLYASLMSRRDLMIVFARVRQGGTLAGLAYGHPWRWADQASDWAGQLRDRLGGAAASLEDRFAVYLLNAR
jgi:hypothetical protein